MLIVQEIEVRAGPRALVVFAPGAEVAVLCRWLADDAWHPVYGLRLGAGRRLDGDGHARTVFCTLAELPTCLDETLVLQHSGLDLTKTVACAPDFVDLKRREPSLTHPRPERSQSERETI